MNDYNNNLKKISEISVNKLVNMKIEISAKLRYLRMAPRKMRLVTDLICGLSPEEAIAQLKNINKLGALPVLKLLNSALANAVHNYEMDKNELLVKNVTVDGGPVLKRWMPRAMGRATPIRKRTSHITLILEGEATDKVIQRVKALREKYGKKIVETVKEKKTVKKVKKVKKEVEK